MLSALLPRIVFSLLLGAGAYVCLLEMFYLRDQQIEVNDAIADVGRWKRIFAAFAALFGGAALLIFASYWF